MKEYQTSSANISADKCICSFEEDMKHIYECEYWNEENKNENIPFEEIFEDNIDKQVKVSQQFYLNFQIREKHMNKQNYEDNEESHAILVKEPLSSLSLSIVLDNK